MTRYNVTRLAIFSGTLGLLNVFSLPAIAKDFIGNRGIEFQEDTIIEFEFIRSHGAYQSTFGVIDLDSCQSDGSGIILFDTCTKTPLLKEVTAADTYNPDDVYRSSAYQTNSSYYDNIDGDFVGTPGNAVPEPKAEFLFKANQKYAFYLESEFNGRPAGTVYSTDFFNAHGHRQALFGQEGLTTAEVVKSHDSSPAPVNENYFAALVDGGVRLYFDDTGSTLVREDLQDKDFDDFIVGIGGSDPCKDTESNTPEVSLDSEQ